MKKNRDEALSQAAWRLEHCSTLENALLGQLVTVMAERLVHPSPVLCSTVRAMNRFSS